MRKLTFLNIVFFLSTQFYLAQVDLKINDGMLVETSGGVSIQISGNVIEENSGYLNGVVESGSRTSIISFAGLTFNQGFTVAIKRTTGSQYSGNGAGKNILRHYQIINSGSTVSRNISVTVNEKEIAGMNGPFFLYTYDTDWKGYSDGSIDLLVSANDINIETGVVDFVISEGVGISAKIFLEAPYNSVSSNMRTTLNPYIPTNSPYVEDPRIVSAIPTDAVDWVLIQVRKLATESTIESRAAFMNTDGYLIEDDGSLGVGIKAKPDDYHIVIKHRNHISVMTNEVQAELTWGIIPEVYDFTDDINKYYGTNGAKEIESGIWGMWCGDTNGDARITDTDKVLVNNIAVYEGYHDADLNFDGSVTNADKFLVNTNKVTSPQTQVP
ncbi:MAG: hypothetical protein ABFS12_14590 [Bacteroidota bacterium]